MRIIVPLADDSEAMVILYIGFEPKSKIGRKVTATSKISRSQKYQLETRDLWRQNARPLMDSLHCCGGKHGTEKKKNVRNAGFRFYFYFFLNTLQFRCNNRRVVPFGG